MKRWEFGAGVAGFTGFLIDYNQQMFVPDSESADMMLKRLELYKRLYTQIAEVQKEGLNNNRVATPTTSNGYIPSVLPIPKLPL